MSNNNKRKKGKDIELEEKIAPMVTEIEDLTQHKIFLLEKQNEELKMQLNIKKNFLKEKIKAEDFIRRCYESIKKQLNINVLLNTILVKNHHLLMFSHCTSMGDKIYDAYLRNFDAFKKDTIRFITERFELPSYKHELEQIFNEGHRQFNDSIEVEINSAAYPSSSSQIN